MTNIEWVRNPDNITQGITVNSKTGCRNHTPEGLCFGGLFPCYGFGLAHKRLKQRYLNHQIFPVGVYDDEFYIAKPLKDPFYPRWWPDRLDKIRAIKKPTGIFLDDMSDWMWDGWPERWTRQEIQVMKDCPQHRFYTLTKQPQRLPEFSPFPENCWVGVTATNAKMLREGLMYLEEIQAEVKFVSLEPLLSRIYDFLYFLNALPDFLSVIDWLIIGACTGTYREMELLAERLYAQDDELKFDHPLLILPLSGSKYTLQPSIEWAREIVEAADKAGIPVFLKDNLAPLLQEHFGEVRNQLFTLEGEEVVLRQEMPEQRIAQFASFEQ